MEEALASIFGRERIDNFKTIQRFLVIGLASHFRHYDEINKLLPDSSKIRHMALYTSLLVASLKKHVRIAMPWEDHYKYFSPATGIPPHVINYRYFEEIKSMLSKLPEEIGTQMDTRQFNGQISLDQVKRS